MWPALLLIVCGALPIFDTKPDNPWDRVRDVFYTHRFTNGEVYESDQSLTGPPWYRWGPFYYDAAFHDRVAGVLDAFLKLPREQVEGQSALRRAILLRDLWPVFEAQCERSQFPADEPANRQAILRQKLARIMMRLELTPDEAGALPDTYRNLLNAKVFADHFDAQSPDKPFLAPDLLKADGPWIAIARDTKTLGAQAHLDSVNYRSAFVPFLRVSDRRQDAIDYLQKFQDFDPKVDRSLPDGSQLALLRRMMLPTSSGRILVTPVVESLQLIVADSPYDRRFKFVLDRKAFMTGGTTLRPLDEDDSIDAYSLEQASVPRGIKEEVKTDTDGEPLVLGEYTGKVPYKSLNQCAVCHGRSVTVDSPLFGNMFGPTTKPVPMDWAEQIRRIIRSKEKSKEWKAYLTERKAIARLED